MNRPRNDVGTFAVLGAAFTYLVLFRSYGFQVEDEGTLLFHLDRAARGEAPYTEFHTGYTPGYFWIGAAALELVDRSTASLRVLLAFVNASSAALLYHLARRGAPAVLALLAPLAWLAFMPIYPGAFVMFNVPYPAWLATLCWLLVCAGLLRWQHNRSLAVLALCGFIASVAFSIKLNAGAYAAAACVWVVVATTRTDSILDRSAAVAASMIVAVGVWSAFGLRLWGTDAGVHLLPLLAIVGVAILGVRGRFAADGDVGALRALGVLSVAFMPLTLAWSLPTMARLGADGFASEVLLLGSNAAEIYWRDHPAVEPYAVAVALGVIGLAVLGRMVMRGLAPFRVAVALVVVGGLVTGTAATTLGVMAEGRAASVVLQLQNASYWLGPLVHWGALLLVVKRVLGQRNDDDTARWWVMTVCAIAMYWQLYPRTDFAHIMFAVPVSSALAVWLLSMVLDWWSHASRETKPRMAAAAAAVGIAVAAVPMGMAISAALASRGVQALTGSAPRIQVVLERDAAAELESFGRAVDFLTSNTVPGEPLLTFPALSGLTFAAGLTNPVEHDYWYPERPDHDAESHMLTILGAAPPRFVATVNTGWTFFFDSPAYFERTGRWVGENYRLIRRFGRFDVLARNDVLPDQPRIEGGLLRPQTPTAQIESEPPAVTGFVARSQAVRRWSATIPPDLRLRGPLSADRASAILQLRGLRDAGDLRCAAFLYSGYASDDARLQREAASAARMVVDRYNAEIHRWAHDLRPGDYAPYLSSSVERAERYAAAPDEGIRKLSALVATIMTDESGR